MATSLIGLGSNLGDRAATLDAAISRLSECAGVRVIKRSSGYETDPIGGPSNQGPFVNAAAILETSLAPDALLSVLREVESTLGRQRDVHWGARTVDLDLLLYDEQVVASAELCVPHPRMTFRRFVLEPACEIAGDWRHPQCRRTLSELLESLRATVHYVAIAGAAGSGKTQLARNVVDELNRLGWFRARLVADDSGSLDPAASTAEPAGCEWDVPLKFLRCHRRLLDKVRWSDTDDWLVSDFWLDQSLASSDLCHDRQQAAAFREQWQDADKRVMRPKLLVVLDSCEERIDGETSLRSPSSERMAPGTARHRMQVAINDLLGSAGHGPILRLGRMGGAGKQRAIDEVVAAVLAMR